MLKIKFLIAIVIVILFLGLLIIGDIGSGISQGTSDNSKDNSSPNYLSNPDTLLLEGEPISDDVILSKKIIETKTNLSLKKSACLGVESCIYGIVTEIIDGDTIKVNSNSIRFALASAPELDEEGGTASKKFIEVLCPVGSEVIVDQDDLQPLDKYGRMIAMIHCNGNNLNEELVESKYGFMSTQFCNSSEFMNQKWVKDNGCLENAPHLRSLYEQDAEFSNDVGRCDPSYLDFCIASPPPDLDCGDISQKKFTVLQPDPHRFDGDKDGLGCES